MGNLSKITFGTPQFDELVALRDLVLRQPLGMQFYVEDISNEYLDHHFGYFDENWNVLGALQMRVISTADVKMRQVAVHPEYQGKGIGKAMVREVEYWAKQNGFRKIVLSARKVAIAFYESLEYTIVSEEYEEVGIPHRKMEKELL